MKGIIFVIDGMGDRPVKELDDKTPLEAANTPYMNKMVEEIGECQCHGMTMWIAIFGGQGV